MSSAKVSSSAVHTVQLLQSRSERESKREREKERERERERERDREKSFDNLLVQIHYVIQTIRGTGLAPWKFEFPVPSSLASTILGFCGKKSTTVAELERETRHIALHIRGRDHTFKTRRALELSISCILGEIRLWFPVNVVHLVIYDSG